MGANKGTVICRHFSSPLIATPDVILPFIYSMNYSKIQFVTIVPHKGRPVVKSPEEGKTTFSGKMHRIVSGKLFCGLLTHVYRSMLNNSRSELTGIIGINGLMGLNGHWFWHVYGDVSTIWEELTVEPERNASIISEFTNKLCKAHKSLGNLIGIVAHSSTQMVNLYCHSYVHPLGQWFPSHTLSSLIVSFLNLTCLLLYLPHPPHTTPPPQKTTTFKQSSFHLRDIRIIMELHMKGKTWTSLQMTISHWRCAFATFSDCLSSF